MSLQASRGVALLMVVGLLALLATVVLDFQFNSRVDLELSYNARDALQAEYNALSALRMRALILKQSRKVQVLMQALMGGAGGGLPLGQIMEMIPVECGLMNAITKPKEALIDDAPHQDDAHQEFFVGECMATSESEHSKIPLNLLRNNIQDRASTVAAMLLGLLSDPRLKRHFEADDRSGTHADSPLALVQAITDYIDSDHTEALNLGDEDRRYQFLKDPYRAKNAPFDSVAELQLVYGVSDRLYEALRDHVTIYNDNPAIELATAPVERIIYFGLPSVLKDGVPADVLIPVLPQVAARIMSVRSLGAMVPFTTSILTQLLQQSGLSQVIDPKKMQTIFSDSSSTTWYTLLSEGRMGRTTKRMRAVFQASEGQFYYVRID